MKYLAWTFFALLSFTLPTSGFSLENDDILAIESVIQGISDSWNNHAGVGIGDAFTEDADFVNIFGMHFSGRDVIEERHVVILNTFLRGTTLEILGTQLREVQPGLVIAHVRWSLGGFQGEGVDSDKISEGIFTEVFVQTDEGWRITACQNTLITNLMTN